MKSSVHHAEELYLFIKSFIHLFIHHTIDLLSCLMKTPGWIHSGNKHHLHDLKSISLINYCTIKQTYYLQSFILLLILSCYKINTKINTNINTKINIDRMFHNASGQSSWGQPIGPHSQKSRLHTSQVEESVCSCPSRSVPNTLYDQRFVHTPLKNTKK